MQAGAEAVAKDELNEGQSNEASLKESDNTSQAAIWEKIKAEYAQRAEEEEASRKAIEQMLQADQAGAVASGSGSGGAAGRNSAAAASSQGSGFGEKEGQTWEEMVQEQQEAEDALLKRKSQEDADAEMARCLDPDAPRAKRPKLPAKSKKKK